MTEVAPTRAGLSLRLVHEPACLCPLIREEIAADGSRLRMVADHLLVRLEADRSLAELEPVLACHAARVRRVQPLSGLVLVVFDGRDPERLRDLQAVLEAEQGLVGYAEPDYLFQATEEVATDPRFDAQWALHDTGQDGGLADAGIDAPQAWEITRGRPEVVIGIADSGIEYTHDDLASQMWTNPGEIPDTGLDDDGNGFVDDYFGYDFVDEDGDPFDKDTSNPGSRGHGTQQALRDAVRANADAGLLVVAAAGNSGRDLDGGNYIPAGLDEPNIIAVAASDRRDRLATFSVAGSSNFGDETVYLAAPGKALQAATLDNGYRIIEGTSPAAPHVAAAAALCFSIAGPDVS